MINIHIYTDITIVLCHIVYRKENNDFCLMKTVESDTKNVTCVRFLFAFVLCTH